MKRGRSKRVPFVTSTSLDTEELIFTPLGSGNEVGRSSHLLEFKGKKILLDCGLHPGKQGGNALPFFDVIDPAQVDIILISHFHVDHVASLPYFTEHTNFKGEIYMTRPTRVVSELLLNDYVRIIENNTDKDEAPLYDTKDVAKCLNKCQVIDFHQVITVKGIKFSPLHAGHVLGAAMFLIEISNIRILYTGDFSSELDRHLIPAEVPSNIEYKHSSKPLDLLIMESTFGTMVHQPRDIRETMFTSSIVNILNRGGVCLIPVFSLGRAQELLLILENYWSNNEHLHQFKIYHYSKLASKALEVYKTYINVMNEEIRNKQKIRNPWTFNYIFPFSQSKQRINNIVNEPCVIMASPGMMQNGVSRQIFEKISNDEKNGLLLCGYSVEGTLAYSLSRDSTIKTYKSMNGSAMLNIKCSIEEISFAAHSDILSTRNIVNKIKPLNLILVHGNTIQIKRLRKDLNNYLSNLTKVNLSQLNIKLNTIKNSITKETKDNSILVKLENERSIILNKIKTIQEASIRIFMPYNTQSIVITFKNTRNIKLVGNLSVLKKKYKQLHLSSDNVSDDLRLTAYLVRKNFDEMLIDKNEVETYTELTRNTIKQQIFVPFHGSLNDLKEVCESLFEIKEEDGRVNVENLVEIEYTKDKQSVCLHWVVSIHSDIIAEALITLLLQHEGGVLTLKHSNCLCKGHKGNAKQQEEISLAEVNFEKICENNESFLFLFCSLQAWFGVENIQFTNIDSKVLVTLRKPEEPEVTEVLEEQRTNDEEEKMVTETSNTICKLLFDTDGTLLKIDYVPENSNDMLKEKILDIIEGSLTFSHLKT